MENPDLETAILYRHRHLNKPAFIHQRGEKPHDIFTIQWGFVYVTNWIGYKDRVGEEEENRK